tara:strand:+ start:100 stop:204 length:105 start_codon:yes stop_codon:yes gene_type:complete
MFALKTNEYTSVFVIGIIKQKKPQKRLFSILSFV